MKFELLDINIEQLQKIIHYGRLQIFEFLLETISHKIFNILKNSNPFDFSNSTFDYIDDIWDGNFWYENEYTKKII